MINPYNGFNNKNDSTIERHKMDEPQFLHNPKCKKHSCKRFNSFIKGMNPFITFLERQNCYPESFI